MAKGLEQTAPLWAPIRVAADWLHQAAHLLSEDRLLTSLERQQQLRHLLQTMQQQKATAGSLETGIEHFLKVSDSYWAGLFHTYEIEALPRTNNDLEGSFGQLRHHQRRVSGRKAAPASLVLRGAVRLCKISRTSAPKSHPTSAGHSHELRQVKLIQPKPSARLR